MKLISLLFLSALLLVLSTGANAQSDNKSYCDQLIDLYRRYIQNSPGHRFDLDASNAMEQCRKGNTEAGVPVLEKKLQQGQISLPGNFKP